MKVVIVAKTRMGSGACIGALNFDGQSLRLIATDRESNDQFNMEYNVGEVWDVDAVPDPDAIPPHVENIVVHGKRRLPDIATIIPFIETQMPPISGGMEALFQGLTQATKVGAMYITERTGVPGFSTMFWRPDKALVRDDDAKRIRYRYPTDDGGRTLTFVGFQDPLPALPEGTLLRVSLAHWWRPKEMPEGELRCYVQLSGWFLPTVNWPPYLDEGFEEQPLTQSYGEPQSTSSASVELEHASSPKKVLKRVFGYDSFLPLQRDIIGSLRNGRDTLAIMPTGSGKSLCYQLPALLSPGLTVVVSPLISLMEDQVMQLRELGIPAVYLNSSLSYGGYLRTTRQIRSGQVKLLYASPETLLRPETQVLLEQVPVDCMTIDEAHCISEWGHEFRPEYRRLVDLRKRIPGAVCLAVTATATERVRQDIKTSLGIPVAHEFIASFNRQNLFLEVETRHDALGQVETFLDTHRGESGIIYCSTRRGVDGLASELAERGWPTRPYHAGLDEATRRRNQRWFSRSDDAIMVATIAFGMGIDKSNVRFVVHADLPKNLESYYQQIGRAGRDGLRADCLLLYERSDVATIYHFMDKQEAAERRRAQERLDALLGFVETATCRRRPLLAYFNELYEQENCDMCDNCTGEHPEPVDLTIPAQKFLSCVIRTRERFGINHIVDVLRGSRAKTVLSRGHEKLSTYNIGREYSAKTWRFLGRQFIQLGLLERYGEYGVLKVTAVGHDVLRGKQLWGQMPEVRDRKARRLSEADYDAELFEMLRAKRLELAEARDVPPFFVFSDRSLLDMATYYPQSEDSLGRMYGVGKVKLAKYSEHVLPVIRAYCRERNLSEKRKTGGTSSRTRKRRDKRQSEILELYNNGRTLDEISAAYNIKKSTVLGHLWRAVQSGQTLNQMDLLQYSRLAPELQEAVLNAFEEYGIDRLRPIFDELDGKVAYDELHLIRLHFAAQLALTKLAEP